MDGIEHMLPRQTKEDGFAENVHFASRDEAVRSRCPHTRRWNRPSRWRYPSQIPLAGFDDTDGETDLAA